MICSSCGETTRKQTVPQWAKRTVAWAMFVVGTTGFLLAVLRVIGVGEDYLTHCLSWAALAYAGFVALEVS